MIASQLYDPNRSSSQLLLRDHKCSLSSLEVLTSSQLLHHRLSLRANSVSFGCSVGCVVEYSDPSVKSESQFVGAKFPFTQRFRFDNSFYCFGRLSDTIPFLKNSMTSVNCKFILSCLKNPGVSVNQTRF